MAERRMFSKSLIFSDRFTDMPSKAKILYFYLALYADDDGFVNRPKSVMRMFSCNQKTLDILINEGFLLPFESGVVAIRHWRMHNHIQKDRYKPTECRVERAGLSCDSSGVYSYVSTDGNGAVYASDTEVRIGEDSIGKESVGEDSIGEEEEKQKEREGGTTMTTGITPPTIINHIYKSADAQGEYEKKLDFLAEYFAENGFFSSVTGFVAYNEARGWRGIGGEDVLDHLPQYADEWEKNERLQKHIPLDARYPEDFGYVSCRGE